MKKPTLNGIKVGVFFRKKHQKKHLCYHDKNHYYFCKSNIPVINLIVGSRNMINVSKNMSLQKNRLTAMFYDGPNYDYHLIKKRKQKNLENNSIVEEKTLKNT